MSGVYIREPAADPCVAGLLKRRREEGDAFHELPATQSRLVTGYVGGSGLFALAVLAPAALIHLTRRPDVPIIVRFVCGVAVLVCAFLACGMTAVALRGMIAAE